ncbi:MAG: RnfABCDGE type electron transport complex subunit D [Candidatus Margulisiibacteriota bacterium]|jgi:electron transport complex protein RnfD
MIFQVSLSPHIRATTTVKRIMFLVVIALMPAICASLYFFQIPALIVYTSTIFTALITEALIMLLRRRSATVFDGSALLTGVLLAMNLPPSTPWWVASIGSFFAIAIVKQAFGGLGMNIFNPALAARAFLLASYPMLMTTWHSPLTFLTTATPLGVAKHDGIAAAVQSTTYLNSFLGLTGGSLGETSALAILIGGLFLMLLRIIDWRIPFCFLTTVAIIAGIFGQDMLFHLLNGGLLLGAFFMATDYVTSPITPAGKMVFGIGCGIITMVIRLWGGYPEGVCYSILLMNALTPFLDKIRWQRDVFIE